MVSVLGIDVCDDLVRRWTRWFAPALQPFRADRLPPESVRRTAHQPSLEIRDTYWLYDGRWAWLGESEFTALPFGVRRGLLVDRAATGRISRLRRHDVAAVGARRTGQRVVWWPGVLREVGVQPVIDYVTEAVRPSRHREIDWTAVRLVLPGAVPLAGTFANGSGPNCFATVMAAAGERGTAGRWMQREPFEKWLGANSTAIRDRRNTEPGIVLVWRNRNGRAEHAAIALGEGYALVKPSQAWCSPRAVWTVSDTIAAGRARGLTLQRYRLKKRS